MSMKRKWLKALMMLMMAFASFGGVMNPKEIEDLLYIMNETRIEFTIPNEDDKGDGGRLPPARNSLSAAKSEVGSLPEKSAEPEFG